MLVGSHRASQGFRATAAKSRRLGWDEHYGDLTLEIEARDVLAELRALPTDGDSFGLLHGDLNAWNVLDDAGIMTAIDFENAYYGWFAGDIAASLYYTTHDRKYWFEDGAYPAWAASQGIAADDDAFQAYFLRGLLEGYRAVRPLDESWEARIPLFLDLRLISDPDFS